MEIPISFQLPAYSLASISKLPFFGILPIEAIGNIPIENKGIPDIARLKDLLVVEMTTVFPLASIVFYL